MATGPDLQCVGVFVVHTDRESDLDVHTRTGLNQRYVAKNNTKACYDTIILCLHHVVNYRLWPN